MSDTQKTILGGVTVLGISGIICKIVGVLYRIPLAWLIGEGGMGTYQLVFPTYNMLLTVSSAGLPVAISRMVSYSLARDDPRNARRVFRIAVSLLASLGFLGTLLMLVGSQAFSDGVRDPETRAGFIAIAPALFLVCTMSAFRGFMQGQRDMRPTAISQLIEQVGKVFVALPLAWLGSRVGYAQTGAVNIGMSAAGALAGTSLAEAAALLYMMLLYRRRKPAFDALAQDAGAETLNRGVLTRRLLSLAIPITLGACIVPLAAFVDSHILVDRLVDSAGVTMDEARAAYGRYSGYVLTLINVPTAIAIAISMSLVPAISEAMARRDADALRAQSAQGLRFAFLIGLPCSIGMSILSKPLLSMIYPFSSPEALEQTAGLLSLSSLTIVLFTVVQATSGILQGLRKQRIPMYTLMAGVAAKIVLNYTLVGMPQINIFGAPIASIVCYTTSMLPNLYYVHKYARMKPDVMGLLVRPGIATAGMGALLLVCKRLLPAGRLWTTLLVLIGMIGFVAFALWTGAMTQSDWAPLFRRFRRNKRGGNERT